MSETKLKPCPFCERSATYFERSDKEGHAVICTGYMCGVFISGTPVHPAIPKWNTRTPDPRIAVLREAGHKAYEAMTGNNDPFDPEVWAKAVDGLFAALETTKEDV